MNDTYKLDITNMKKVLVGDKTGEEFTKEHKCPMCRNKNNCNGYNPIYVALDSSYYVETCDDYRANIKKGNPIWYDTPKPYKG